LIRRFLKKYGWRYLPGAVFLFLSSYIQALAPLALGRAIDDLSASPIVKSLVFHEVFLIVMIALGTFVTRFIWRYFIIGNARNMECWLREELFTHLQGMPADFFNHQKTGDLIAYAINDVNAVRMTFGPAIAQLLSGVGIGLFSVLSMANDVQPALTLFALLPILPALVAVYFIGNQVQRKFGVVQERFAEISGTVQENIAGMRVIKAFAQEAEQIRSFTRQSGEMQRANVSLVKTSSLLVPLITILFGVSFLITLLYGGNLVQTGAITLGSFVAFNSYLIMIVQPVLSVARVVNLFQRGMASLRRLGAIIHAPGIPAVEYGDLPEPLIGRVEARNLTFRYPGAQANALEDISFTLEAGQVLGVVGATGSGKTTLASLLMKFYDTGSGMLLVDGRDIRDLPAKGLRDHISYVPQDGFLFSATVEENISFYTPGSTHADVVHAAELAGLAKDIGGFAAGYETNTGERGSHLSGGQKQRVAIARALLRGPSVIILDDSLSAVDNETERLILNNLKKFFPGRTVLIISHRLSAVEQADKILCLDRGRVAEQGTHSQLLALGGLYANYYRKQTQEEEDV
jgi:ATP-binding cassette, subfamily B, multidrug efflux pump